jgi:hypothetical protein
MRAPLFASLVCAAACGGDRRASGGRPQAETQHQNQNQNQTTAEPDAAAPVEPVVALPKRSCPPAHAATLGSCSDGLRCVLLLEITDACVVKVANEIDIPDGASESDGAGIADLAWPTKDGSLYLVNRTETWSWAELPSAKTAARDALGKVTWNPTKVGEMEPEGYQYGLATDGAKAYLAGCKKWGDDCGPDSEECEEWFCKQHVFVDPHTKKKLAKAPAAPFVTATTAGKVTETVTIAKKGKTLTCAAGSAAAEEWMEDPLDGVVALSPTDWLAVRYRAGSRMNAAWGADVDYMSGCGSTPAVDSYGAFVVGPNQLWARATQAGFELNHGPHGTPLTDATGKIKAFGDSFFVFAAD